MVKLNIRLSRRGKEITIVFYFTIFLEDHHSDIALLMWGRLLCKCVDVRALSWLKKRLPFCTDALMRRNVDVSQTTRVCTCADGDPKHPDIPSASLSEKKTNKHPPHRHRSPLTSNSFFVFLPYLPVFRWTNSVLSWSSNNLARVVLFWFWFFNFFLTVEDPLPHPEPSTHQEVICFRDYCTCVGNLGAGGLAGEGA